MLWLVLFILWWSNCVGFNLLIGGFIGGFIFCFEVFLFEEFVEGVLNIILIIINLIVRNMLVDYLIVCFG